MSSPFFSPSFSIHLFPSLLCGSRRRKEVSTRIHLTVTIIRSALKRLPSSTFSIRKLKGKRIIKTNFLRKFIKVFIFILFLLLISLENVRNLASARTAFLFFLLFSWKRTINKKKRLMRPWARFPWPWRSYDRRLKRSRSSHFLIENIKEKLSRSIL